MICARAPRRRVLCWLLTPLVAASLAGCAAVGDIAGAVAGLATGAATANPALGISVGIAVRAGTNEIGDRISRARRHNEQDAIAEAAAAIDAGQSAPWSIDQRLRGDAYGEVHVLRVIDTPLATCKELLFSVIPEGREEARWFTTTTCLRSGVWKWAAAEPAVGRWVNLQ